MFKKIAFTLVICFMFFACNQPRTESNAAGTNDSINNPSSIEISDETMGEIIKNLASPIEMAALLKNIGLPFSADYLKPNYNIDNYNTQYKRALGIGLLGADIAYQNVYGNTAQVVNYFNSIKKLADALKVGQFFDENEINHLSSDSLMFASISSFNRMDSYLREKKRSNISAVIVTGIWFQGLYQATQAAKTSSNKELIERIGEQKIILNELTIILQNFIKEDKFFADLNDWMNELKREFDGVKITYTPAEPKSEVKNGVLTIIQRDESHVEITSEQVSEIIASIEKIRNKMIE